MKAPLSVGQLAVTVLSLSSVASALAWPRWLPEVDSLVVRQEDEDTSGDSPAPKPTPPPSKSDAPSEDEEPPKTTSRSPFEPITSNLNTGGRNTGTATGTGRANGTATRAPHRTMFNPMDPAGSVVMVTPAPTDGFQLYKIGEYVTWGWNYTNLQGTPTAIDLYVRCSKVPQPWTLTQNMSFAETGSYTWDTGAFQSSVVANPLLTEQYTLVINDADTGPSATPEPGYLAPFSGFYFGLYEGQEYHDTNDGWQCASCSGAMSGLVDRRGVGVAAVMSVATVLSFTWFVAGFGAF
ncbi:hypothetical protein VTK26DRAFT_2049 [Humicola hyalothermophila]